MPVASRSTNELPSGAQAAANASSASFAALTAKLSYLSAGDVDDVRRAYRFADEAHLGQLRKNGEPYITHPIAVAAQCAAWKLDAHALMAALLHDAMEDCGVTKAELIERFGSVVADLVDGLTKLDKLHFTTREEIQAESFRKMLLAMARDVRVIIIKLADRSHNMRTLGDVPRAKWARTAQETLDIYAPIAHRLGLNETYRELQELSFQYAKPWRHQVLSKALAKARGRRGDFVAIVERDVAAMFGKANLAMQLFGREKTLYSIYRKMDDKHLSFGDVTDMIGFRIIVPTITDCYTALGLIHQLYKPLPGKFKDHIAIGKLNGYQSLHTTVVGPRGINVEFQMRTQPMHLIAESGVAAHWMYKDHEASASAQGLTTQWLQSLLDIQHETRDAAEFWDHVKIDLFPDAVYVFTPRSEIMALPRGATVLDFAYEIHSDVGDHAVSGVVNGESVALRTPLRNGDVVAAVTSPTAHPSPAWLGYVRTGRARSKIRHYLKTMAQADSEALGAKLLAQALGAEGIEHIPPSTDAYRGLWDKLLRFTGNRNKAELLVDLGLGKRIASIVAKRAVSLLADLGERPDPVLLSRERFTAHESITQGALLLDGGEGGTVQYANCCRPIPGDPIVGYLGRAEGLTVHRTECHSAKKLRHKDAERFLEVQWAEEPSRLFNAAINASLTNGKGVLARVAAALASAEADIVHVDMGAEAQGDAAELHFLVGVRDAEHLESALRTLRRVPAVLSAQRA